MRCSYNRILEKLREQSYDVSKLMKTLQSKQGNEERKKLNGWGTVIGD
jgi:hypothetical protein